MNTETHADNSPDLLPPFAPDRAGAHPDYATNGAVAALCAGMVGGMVAIVRTLADRGAINIETFRADLTGLALSTGNLNSTEALALRYFRDQIVAQIPTPVEQVAPRKDELVQ